MAAVWLLPVVPLIVASSTGGLLSEALRPHSHTLALVSTTFSFFMVAMGLAFALMLITVYFLRLIIHSVPDPSLILSAFIVLGPLGQGGFSLLINGASISELLPLHVGADFPQAPLAGQMIFAVCFCGAYALWAIGVAWVVIAVCSIYHVVVPCRTKIAFNLGYWGMIFPNGVFALLIVELSRVLQSPFFKVIGSLWSGEFPARLVLCSLERRSSFALPACSHHLPSLGFRLRAEHSVLHRWFAFHGALPPRRPQGTPPDLATALHYLASPSHRLASACRHAPRRLTKHRVQVAGAPREAVRHRRFCYHDRP